jgi:hypothetical protein
MDFRILALQPGRKIQSATLAQVIEPMSRALSFVNPFVIPLLVAEELHKKMGAQKTGRQWIRLT